MKLGILHANIDLKNIVFTKSGHLALSNLGVSRKFNNAGSLKVKVKKSDINENNLYYLPAEILLMKPSATSIILDSSIDFYALGIGLYYLRRGLPTGDLSQILGYLFNIEDELNMRLRAPKEDQRNFADLILGLTKNEYEERLGNKENGDISDLKNHPFFHGIDWNLIAERKNSMPPGINELLPENSAKDSISSSRIRTLESTIGKLTTNNHSH